MKVGLFYVLNEVKLPDVIWSKYLAVLPPTMKEKALRFRNWQDAQAFVYGKLLIKQGLESLGNGSIDLQGILTTEYGRPYKSKSADFNISHSGKLVICAISDRGRIGVDVEAVRDIDLEDFTRFFTTQEMKRIRTNEKPIEAFYELWTIKESVMKADGRGMSLAPQEILLNGNEAFVDSDIWYVKKVGLEDGYKIHLACDSPVEQIEKIEVDCAQLV